MYSYLKNLENRLNDDQKDMLKRIYEPTVVEIPLSDSRRDLCILPNGEIRSYGTLYGSQHMSQDGQIAYLSSIDCGLSWTVHYSHGKMNSCTYLEKSGIYITACDAYNNNKGIDDGIYIYRSKIGPDDPNPEVIKIAEGMYHDSFLPQQSFYSDRIWFTTQTDNGTPTFCYSDDFGKTWTLRSFPAPHCFETVFPHKGLRWCKGSGTEPYAIELSENKMMMIIRTPMDCFYKCYSYDGGDSWTTPEPSTFYGTNTTAFFLRLTDGRVVTFWNNTKPLSQPNHKNANPTADKSVAEGTGENSFTNRDAAHAAITEDGENFIGYREILLNEVRNNSDFRYIGGAKSSTDKSVHQFQAFELPFNKILVSAGQNKASRRLVIFDVDWLYETSRTDDFLKGMGGLTTHTYLKSISGCHQWEVGNGHCCWNRTYSAYPVPDPEGSYAEVLSISKHHDERLYNDIGGACWNFPATKQGRVSLQLKIAEKSARIILTDRWYNTCDPYVTHYSPFWFELDAVDLGESYSEVNIDYDTEKGEAKVLLGEELYFKVKMSNPCPTGISYLILQCATDGDSKGFFVKKLQKTLL
ncbi:MAG: sialidase family protein [Acutalibacteraceae bacterium]|nr:sialidase family protein [Acutalibacteraceae bacterium]